jgi:hypothetical protein
MPTSEEILTGLGSIANQWAWFAMFWHGYFSLIILTLITGIRPSKRIVALLLVLPLLSVSALAWIHSNPFNGIFFGLSVISLAIIALRLPAGQVRIGPYWLTVPGILMTAFGWLYPHFLNEAAPLYYLYAAPTGLIPCPTTSVVIGLTLVLHGLGSRAWCLVLAATGLFYGVFGAAVLGVNLDWVLFAGALMTAFTGLFIVNKGDR